MNKLLKALLAKKTGLVAQSQALIDAAGDAGLTAEQQTEFDALTAQLEGVNAQIESQRRAIDAARATEGVSIPEGAIRVTENIEADATRGFPTVGHFALAVRQAQANPMAADDRLLTLQAASASTYANESSGADGGYLVPPQYSAGILSVIEAEAPIMPLCRNIPLNGNSITFPKNETTAHGTGGIQAYWDDEANVINQTKPAFTESTLKLRRLTALVPVTEELLEDAPAMSAWIDTEAGAKMAFKVTDAILRGNGVGQPLGILNAPSLVEQVKEGSQAAGTLLAVNIVKMWSRMPVASRRRAVWLVNQDIEAQLAQMSFAVKNVAGTENVGGTLAYFPAGSLAGSPDYASLAGRPVIPLESCSSIGTTGDIVLADLSNYIVVTKSGSVRADQSIHLWFDQNLRAFRFIMRMNGMPWLTSAIARKNGSNTLSHFVSLQTR